MTIFNSRRLAVCNCNCEHYRTKFYFGIWCQNKVIIIIIIIIIRIIIIIIIKGRVSVESGCLMSFGQYPLRIKER